MRSLYGPSRKPNGLAHLALWCLLCMPWFLQAAGPARPNFLWITCEDISPYLGCYGCKEAQTPNLDRLAQEGIRYTRAYANAPVCAVARSTLLTGMYSPTIGTHQMRSRVQLPAAVPAYPKIFRGSGYYCTNNSKKDYNSNFENDPSLWDESSARAHYTNRKEGQPFFAVFNITVTHESQLDATRIAGYVAKNQIPATPRVRPDDIVLPPYHPDLPEIRRDWARLHDLVTLMDGMAGDRLRELEQLGLADDTIVFFYSDHGGQLARAKRFIYNVGTQVPLLVRFPKKWRHLAPGAPGGSADRLVSFVDFPKTVISLAGLPVPTQMQGRIFLGPDAEPPPESVHFYRDRMAERYDFSRAATDGRFYFIRNFMPHRPPGRDSRYGYDVQANWGAWEAHYAAGKCDAIQSQFFQPKPPVELFDTQEDPWHVKNLAGLPGHEEHRLKLEKDLDAWMIEARDIGLIPEPLFHDLVGPDKPFPTLYDYAQGDRYPVARLLQIAKVASLGDPEKLPDYLRWMTDQNPIVRHWGAYGVFMARPKDAGARQAIKDMMADDPMSGNRIIAAQALGLCGEPDAAFEAILKEARGAHHGYVLLQAINAFQYSHTDDRLKRDDWRALAMEKAKKSTGADNFGFDYAQRLVKDALALWPDRRRVD